MRCRVSPTWRSSQCSKDVFDFSGADRAPGRAVLIHAAADYGTEDAGRVSAPATLERSDTRIVVPASRQRSSVGGKWSAVDDQVVPFERGPRGWCFGEVGPCGRTGEIGGAPVVLVAQAEEVVAHLMSYDLSRFAPGERGEVATVAAALRAGIDHDDNVGRFRGETVAYARHSGGRTVTRLNPAVRPDAGADEAQSGEFEVLGYQRVVGFVIGCALLVVAAFGNAIDW